MKYQRKPKRFDLADLKNTLIQLSVLGCLLILGGLLACGSSSSSSDDDTPPLSTDFPQNVAIIEVTASRVIFSVEVADGRFELYSADPSSGQTWAISDYYSANNGMRPMALTSDGNRIGYRADKDRNGTDELYTNLIDGSDENMVTDSIATSTTDNSGTTVHYNWQWVYNSTSLIYRSDPDADGIFEVQTAALNGLSRTEVSADLSVKCLNEHCFKTSDTGRVITFMVESTNQNSEVEQNLYRVLVDGSVLQQLNTPASADSRILDWVFNQAGTQIAFIHQNVGSPSTLNMVDPNTYVVTPLSSGGLQTGVGEFAWSPDDSLIAFTEDGDQSRNLSLYSIETDGSNKSQVIDTAAVTDPVLLEWAWSPDSSRLAYRADQLLSGVNELISATPEGQFHRKLNPPMTSLNQISANWIWAPDASHIAFHADIETAQTNDELYVSSLDGNSRVKVNVDLTSEGSLVTSNSTWSPDSSRIIYHVVDPSSQTSGLYSVTPDGTGQARLNESLQSGESILENFSVSPDSTRVAFQVLSGSGMAGLQLADLSGGNRVSVRTLGFVSQPTWMLDSARLVFVHKDDSDGSEKLYSVLANGTGTVEIY